MIRKFFALKTTAEVAAYAAWYMTHDSSEKRSAASLRLRWYRPVAFVQHYIPGSYPVSSASPPTHQEGLALRWVGEAIAGVAPGIKRRFSSRSATAESRKALQAVSS